MSTARLIERMPATASRLRMTGGVGAAGSMPRTSRAANRSQPTGSSTVTGYGDSSVAPGASTACAGSRYATPSACDSSRAMPRTDRQYPRSGVTSRSSTTSSRPTSGRAGSPGAAESGGSTMIPLWSSPMPSSRAEQIMPSETRSYVRRAAIAKPPGSTVPGRATTTRSPAAKLVAPQMIPRTRSLESTSPTSTWQYRIGFLYPASSSIERTRPTTSAPSTVAARSTTSSTSMPTRTSASSSTAGSAGASTHSRSHATDTRIRRPFRRPG